MLSVVTYLWSPDESGKFSEYRVGDVRLLQRMVARHLSVEHRFIVVTDKPGLFEEDADIHAVPIDWKTHVPGTCYVRFMTFGPKAPKLLGERVLQLDLDTVIVGSLDQIVDRDEDLVLWRNPRKWGLTYPEMGYAKNLAWFNGSMMLHRTGTLGVIWNNFDCWHQWTKDDQWLISDLVGRDHPYWDQSHGVYRLAPTRKRHLGVFGELPENARIVHFPGTAAKEFLNGNADENPWIAEHRR